jgi:hypothetical protein
MLLLVCLSCGKGTGKESAALEPAALQPAALQPAAALPAAMGPGVLQTAGFQPEAASLETLDDLAEIERAGRFFQGMGLAESKIREDAGDFGGAVIAAFKELAWSYGYGGIPRQGLEEGIGGILALYGGDAPLPEISPAEREAATGAARGALAFLGGRWAEASELLGGLGAEEPEPDAFSRWMILVCALEGGEGSRTVRGAYASIRARYEFFPEYWYRGARNFAGTTALEYAERCINLNPRGPFAGECRDILARGMGLSIQETGAIRSRAEIETIVSRAAATGETELLAELFPLISLPDNPYTLYALGALRALAANSGFREFFVRRLEAAGGRLAERLAYISRG